MNRKKYDKSKEWVQSVIKTITEIKSLLPHLEPKLFVSSPRIWNVLNLSGRKSKDKTVIKCWEQLNGLINHKNSRELNFTMCLSGNKADLYETISLIEVKIQVWLIARIVSTLKRSNWNTKIMIWEIIT